LYKFHRKFPKIARGFWNRTFGQSKKRRMKGGRKTANRLTTGGGGGKINGERNGNAIPDMKYLEKTKGLSKRGEYLRKKLVGGGGLILRICGNRTLGRDERTERKNR